MRCSLWCTLLLLPLSSRAAFDDSPYRQTTYGRLPDRYCDPTKPLTDNGGNGMTEGTAWNLNQCKANPTAGQIIGLLPVGSGTPVRLATSNDDNVPAFNPANSGTANARIVFVTKYAAVAMNRATIATNPNRSEFRHDGSAPSISGGIGVGTGCAVLGAQARNYITYDGFFIDMAQAYMKEDSGVIRADESTGTHFKNFATWLAALGGRDANSLELTTSPFVDRAGDDYRIAPGHPAKTASTTGGEVGCYAGSETVGVDVIVDNVVPSPPTSPTVL